jgi:hypothetical protein
VPEQRAQAVINELKEGGGGERVSILFWVFGRKRPSGGTGTKQKGEGRAGGGWGVWRIKRGKGTKDGKGRLPPPPNRGGGMGANEKTYTSSAPVPEQTRHAVSRLSDNCRVVPAITSRSSTGSV